MTPTPTPTYDVSPSFFNIPPNPTPPSTPSSNPLSTSSDLTTTCSYPTPLTSSSPTLDHPSSNISLIVDLSQPPLIQHPRRSSRPHHRPSHLKDFIFTTTHWCNVVTFDSLPFSNQAVLLTQSQWIESPSYKNWIRFGSKL